MSDTFDVYGRVQASMRKLFLGIVITIVVVGVAVTGVILWVSGDDHTTNSKTNSRRSDATVSPSGVPSNQPTDIAVELLEDLKWHKVQGMSMPFSDRYGPRKQQAGIRSGFAHNPLGAVLAAIHITGNAATTPGPTVFEPTIRDQITGRDKDELLTTVRNNYEKSRLEEGRAPGEPLSDGYGSLLGYRIEHYEKNYCAVNVLGEVPAPEGSTAHFNLRAEVQWVDGDWKVIAPLDGDWSNDLTSITAPQGYALFPKRK